MTKRHRIKEEALSQADMKIRALKELDPVAYTKEHDTLGLRNFLGKYRVETLRSWLQFKGITEDAGAVSKMDKETIIRLVNKWVKDKTATFYQKAESVLTAPPKNAKLIEVRQRPPKGKKSAGGKTYHYFIASGPLRIAGAKGIIDVKAGTPVMVGAGGKMWTQTMENIKKRFITQKAKRPVKRKMEEYAAKLHTVDLRKAGQEAERLALTFLKPNSDKEKIYNEVCQMSTDGVRMFVKALGKAPSKDMSREQLLETVLPGREKIAASIVSLPAINSAMQRVGSYTSQRLKAIAPALKAIRDKNKLIDKKINDDIRGELLLNDATGSAEAEAARISIAIRKMKRRWPSMLKAGQLLYAGNVTATREGVPISTAYDHNDTKFFVGSSYLVLSPGEKRLLGELLNYHMQDKASRTNLAKISINELQARVFGKNYLKLDNINNAIVKLNEKLVAAGASVVINRLTGYDKAEVYLVANKRMPASKAEPGFTVRQPAPSKAAPKKKSPVKKAVVKKPAKKAAPKKAPVKKPAAKKTTRKKAHASVLRDSFVAMAKVAPNKPIPDEQIEVVSYDAGGRKLVRTTKKKKIELNPRLKHEDRKGEDQRKKRERNEIKKIHKEEDDKDRKSDKLLERGNIKVVLDQPQTKFVPMYQRGEGMDVYVKGKNIFLTSKEKIILFLGMLNSGRALTGSFLAESIHEDDVDHVGRLIGRINRKLKAAGANAGYRFVDKNGKKYAQFVMNKSRKEAVLSSDEQTEELAMRGVGRMINRGETLKKVAAIVRERRAQKEIRKSRAGLKNFLQRKGFRKNHAKSHALTKPLREKAKKEGLNPKNYFITVFEAPRGKLKQNLGGMDMEVRYRSWKVSVGVSMGKWKKFEAEGTTHKEAFNEIVAQIVKAGEDLKKKRQLKVIAWIAKNLDPIKEAEDRIARRELEKRMRKAEDDDIDEEHQRNAIGEAQRRFGEGDDVGDDADADFDFAREKATASVNAIIRGETATEK